LVTLGIDLGTAFSRAAYVRDGQPRLLEFPDGSRSIPSVVALGGGTTRVGRAALSRATTHPGQTVRAVKRMLGRTPDDPLIELFAARLPVRFETGPQGGLVLRLGEERHAVEDVAAALLRQLADVAEQTLGGRPTAVVLATPYWYGPRQRKALADAATRAGLATAQILSEATCTALSLIEPNTPARMVAVVDVGAAGCTASILEIAPRHIRLVATAGDPLGGGEDVDWGLVRALLKGLAERLGALPEDPAVLELLRQTCEGAKRNLAQVSSVAAVVPFLPIGGGLYNQEVRIAREHVDLLLSDTVTRVADACRRAREGSGRTPQDLAAVVTTGGTARLPAVRAAIERELGPLSARRLDPDGSVALGAAAQAAMLDGTLEAIAIVDVEATPTAPSADAAAPRTPVPPRRPTAPADRPRATSTPRPPTTPPGRLPSLPPAQFRTVPPGQAAESERVQVDGNAFRIELATLLASLRAGAVTEGETQAVASTSRSTDLDDERDEPTPEALAQRVGALRDCWSSFGVAMQASRQYRWDHPQAVRQLERSLEHVAALHAAAPRGLVWDVGAMHFAHRGAVIWKPDRAPFDAIPYSLFVEGLRRVQLKPGLRRDELREFLGVLLRDAALDFGVDDDAATALWDRKLRHVGWLAVESYVDEEDPAFAQARDETARQLGLQADGGEVLAAYAAARKELAPSGTLLALDEDTRSVLTARLLPERAEWLDRFGLALAATWAHPRTADERRPVIDGLAEWAGDQVQSRAWQPLLELFATVDDAALRCERADSSCGLRVEAVAAMFPPERLRAVLELLTDGAEVAPAVLTGLRRLLALVPLDDDVTALAVERFESMSPAARDLVAELLVTRLAGREPLLARALPLMSLEHARRGLAALRELGTPAALAAIRGAFRSPHLEVRMEALAALPESPADLVRDDVTRLVEDPEEELRLRVLETVAARKLLAAGPVLMRRIQSEQFHELSLRERRLVLEAVGALNRSRAEAAAIALLESSGLFRSEAVEQSRTAAAEFLAASTSPQALEALQRATRKKWFSSPAVRETAARAAEQVQHRRSTRPPPPERGDG
jgi:molecular chaperone DnaK (HSP70)